MSVDPKNTLVLQYDYSSDLWKDITHQVLDYSIGMTACKIQYSTNNKWYFRSYNDTKIFCNPDNIDIKNTEVYHNNVLIPGVQQVLLFNGWYRVFTKNKYFTYKEDEVSFAKNQRDEPLMKRILEYLTEVSLNISDTERDFLTRQLRTLFISEESILTKFVNKTIAHKDCDELLIFPFSTNASQQRAVKIAMEEDLSIIQGPPGTGKTQTILNIVANLVVNGKSVAVVSGNNEATRNVFDKINAAGYGSINAFLGNHNNVSEFFTNNTLAGPDVSAMATYNDNIESDSKLLKEGYLKKLKQAENLQMISELEAEKKISDAEYALKKHVIPKKILKKKFSSKKLLELSSVLQCISEKNAQSFFEKIKMIFKFGLINIRDLTSNVYDVIDYLENRYYVAKIEELREENSKIDSFLQANKFDNILSSYTEYSKRIFATSVYERCSGDYTVFTESNYRYRFTEFVRRYPVIYSTTHSIAACSGEKFLYDCIIIDESSQVDIITAFIAFACAKKIVLVGDEKQLTHVVQSAHVNMINSIFEATGLDDCFNYVKNNILACVKQSIPDIKNTMLREHYRCDPEIIGFSNKRFYDGKLVVVKEHQSDSGIKIITHSAHQARGRMNERQVEIIDRELMPSLDKDNTGIIAPYRDQVTLLKERFKDSGMSIDTIHKFQGKECQNIVISTVANRIKFYEDEETIDFLNNPNLINVALSRAISKLYILASAELLQQEGSLIRDLTKYCEYYCNKDVVLQSSVYSVFDLMYDDYSPILEDMKKRMLNISAFQSENIIATVIKDICDSGKCGALFFRFNYPLRAIIKTDSLTDKEDIMFIRNINTHCDFVIYSALNKKIELVIEVDGSQHLEEIQSARDRRKDRLLADAGIKILRLPTTAVDCKEKIINALSSPASVSK